MYPSVAAAVVPCFNLPTLAENSTVIFNRENLPLIFMGDIYEWTDTRVYDLQTDEVKRAIDDLSSKTINVVVRNDGSGTSEIFTSALASFDDSFRTRVTGKETTDFALGTDIPDWCEDDGEECPCNAYNTSITNPAEYPDVSFGDDTDGLCYTDGVCNSNSKIAGCFGPKSTCDGVAWVFDSGFENSGTVTCSKSSHSYLWNYTRGEGNAGVVAAVFALEGSVGYAVLSDALANGLRIANVTNSAGETVGANGDSISFALMELGGFYNDRGNAQLADASSRGAWPIAGYTYYVTRKGLIENPSGAFNVDGTLYDNYLEAATLPSGAQLLELTTNLIRDDMFDCDIRLNTFSYLEWYYTSPTLATIAELLGFTSLPDFISDNLLTSMLNENFCYNKTTSAYQLAKAASSGQSTRIFTPPIAADLVDTYIAVYAEVDSDVSFERTSVGTSDAERDLLILSGRGDDDQYTSDEVSTALGVAYIAESGDLPSSVFAAPWFTIGVAPVYHLGEEGDYSVSFADSLTLARVLTGQTGYGTWDISGLVTNSTASPSSSTSQEIKLVFRTDISDTNEMIFDFLTAASASDTPTRTIVECWKTVACGSASCTARAFSSTMFDASVCTPDMSSRVSLVESNAQVVAQTTFADGTMGLWTVVGDPGTASLAGVNGITPGSDTWLSECASGTSFTVTVTGVGSISLYQASASTSSTCWPIARTYSVTILADVLGENRCDGTTDSPSDQLKFVEWLFGGPTGSATSSGATSVQAVMEQADAEPSSSSFREAFLSSLGYECDPDTSICDAGTYYSGGDCLPCDDGYVSDDGATECKACEPGTYEVDKVKCVLCESDEYQPDYAKTKCKSCPDNSRFLEESGDETIPFIPRQGAENKTQCKCTEGYYSPADEDEGEVCLECPIGGTCVGTGDSATIVPQPVAGYYARSSNPEVFLECLTPFACPGGGIEVCGEGYEGDLCSDCMDGYFMRTGICNLCEPGHRVASVIAALMFVIIAVTLHYIANIDRSGSLMRSTTAAAAEVQSTILFLQIFNLFLVIRVNWPSAIRQLMQWFSWVNIDLSVLSLECTYPIDYTTGWRLKVLFPYLFGLFYVAYTIVAWPYLLFYKFREDLGLARRECVVFIYKSINATFLISSILYISTVKTLFEPFACTRQPDGTLTMPLYPALECGSEQYLTEIMPTAYVTLFTIAIGYPVLLALVFASGYDTMSEAVFISTQIVRAPYKKKYYFWEVVDLLRKLILAIVLNFANNLTTGAQLAGLSIVIIVALILQVSYRPFKHINVNSLVVYIFSVLLFVLITAGMIFNENDESTSNGWAVLALPLPPTGSSDARCPPPSMQSYHRAHCDDLLRCHHCRAIFLHQRGPLHRHVLQGQAHGRDCAAPGGTSGPAHHGRARERHSPLLSLPCAFHQVLVTPELLDTTVEQLRGVQSTRVIEQCKEIIDDEDMQRAFNDAVCLLFVLSTTSKGIYGEALRSVDGHHRSALQAAAHRAPCPHTQAAAAPCVGLRPAWHSRTTPRPMAVSTSARVMAARFPSSNMSARRLPRRTRSSTASSRSRQPSFCTSSAPSSVWRRRARCQSQSRTWTLTRRVSTPDRKP